MPRIVLLALFTTLVASPVLAQTGNGAPSGPHYNLNIVGIDPEKAKKVDMTDSNRHTIFVKLGVRKQDGTGAVETKIYLGASDDFVVCDGNGFDEAHDCTGTLVSQGLYGAVFGLPWVVVTVFGAPCVAVACGAGCVVRVVVTGREPAVCGLGPCAFVVGGCGPPDTRAAPTDSIATTRQILDTFMWPSANERGKPNASRVRNITTGTEAKVGACRRFVRHI